MKASVSMCGNDNKKVRTVLTFLHSFGWYVLLAVSLIATLPLYLWVKSKKDKITPREFDHMVHKIASRWAQGNVRRSRSRFHITGLENVPKDEAVVFVSNHQGDFDIAAFLAFLPVPHGYVAKIEIMKIPILRSWMKLMRCVFIDRKSIRQTAGALLEGVKTLKDGQSLVLFPEGTRSKSNQIGEFKPASFKLATKAKVPIVPVSITGTYLIFEANNGLIRPADVYVKIHPAIRTDELEDLSELPKNVKEIIVGGMNEKG